MTSCPAAMASIVAVAAARSWSPRSAITLLFDLDGDSPSARRSGGTALRAGTALADDVELWVVADRPVYEPRDGRAFKLGQMLAGEEGDEVRGGVDGSAVDAIHASQP